jgi:hypothetical protein
MDNFFTFVLSSCLRVCFGELFFDQTCIIIIFLRFMSISLAITLDKVTSTGYETLGKQ